MPRTLSLALLLTSCGASTPASSPPPEPASDVTEAAEPAEGEAPVVALHEWGLVDVDLASRTAELSAGPGAPAVPVVARKPVLYAHLIDREAASLDLRVRLPEGGAVLEHWPPAAIEGRAIPWHLEVRRGACPAPAAPSRDLARACDAPDGFCEVAELPRYVTRDHDCIEVGGQRAALLFYRASIPLEALPLRVERAADLTVRVTAGAPRAPGTILRVSSGLSGPWPPGHLVLARAALPVAAGTVEVPVGEAQLEPGDERSAMERTLTSELGLTADEARVFLEAWADELFGPAQAARESRRRAGPRQRDELLYWLSAGEIDRVAALEASAPIVTRRAFLVRVALGAVPTAGPAAR